MNLLSTHNPILAHPALLLGAALSLCLPTALAQSSEGYPPRPAGSPTAVCTLNDAPADSPVRILTGNTSIPYAFACGKKFAPDCIGGTLKPELVVTVGSQQDSWSCVTGGDSTTGWVPSDRVAPLPDAPHIPLSEWIGWWHQLPVTPHQKNNLILISQGKTPGTLHVSGRAYWYGSNDNVHLGEISPTEAKPVGPYLHIVDGDTLSSCVVDLQFDPKSHTLQAYDNANCGGMNVRFLRTWTRFSPSAYEKKH
jgi:hypothetical protein